MAGSTVLPWGRVRAGAATAVLATTLLSGACRPAPPAPPADQPSLAGSGSEDWTLVWSDEFDGAGIDPAKWEHEINAWGGGNNELQYYTDRRENSFVEEGRLVIRALAEDYTGPEGTRRYTSARLRTKNRGDWTYGRFEIRAKLPRGRGLWPAIWMLPTDEVYGGWASSGEIDIMELLGHEPAKVYGTLHYGGEWPDNVQTGEAYELAGSSFAEDPHVFAIEWEPGEIRWFVDDTHTQTQSSWRTAGAEFPAPFDQRFHLLLNVAVGGNWPGDPDETTSWPQTMEVDYVRVYQRAVDEAGETGFSHSEKRGD